MRILAIDYGEKRVGLAISDPAETMALSLGLFENYGTEQDIERLAQRIAESGAEEVVIGLPLNMDGTVGPSARRVMRVVEQLKHRISVPIVTWDERLTSEEARVRMRGVEMTRKKKRAHLNLVSAQIILEAYLAFRHRK